MNTRRFFTTTAAMAAMMAAGAMTLRAQPLGRGHGGGGNRLDYLTGYLSLTDAQKTQAQAIFDATRIAAATAEGAIAAAHTALNTAVKAGSSDAELDRLGAALGAAQGQMAAARAKADVKFRALLTAEQKAKLDTLRESGMERRVRGFRGGRGPR